MPAATALVLWGLLVSARPEATQPQTPGRPEAMTRLEVTEGHLAPLSGGRLRIEEPKVRAVAATGGTPRVVELRFTYLGPTRQQQALRSGEQRRQVGLKLRARDGCNVVYVMWRLAPAPGLVVSVKSNPGLSRSADCGNHGYATVKPTTRALLPDLQPGEPHTLRAELQGERLNVSVDGAPVWEGTLPAEALAFDGPPGLRSDNGRFEVQLRGAP